MKVVFDLIRYFTYGEELFEFVHVARQWYLYHLYCKHDTYNILYIIYKGKSTNK